MLNAGSWIRVLSLLTLASAAPIASTQAHAAACRFRADGVVGQTISVEVPRGADTATVTAIVDGRPDKSGSVQYSRAQLAGLNTTILVRQQAGDPAYRSTPDNQVQCMLKVVAHAIGTLDHRASP